MKVFKQKNVFYVDINKEILEGYTELHIIKEGTENRLSFKSCCLTIENIEILESKHNKLEPKYTAKNKLAQMENSDGFDVIIPKNYKLGSFTIRICYSKNETNPGIAYYKPVYEKDTHREMIVETAAYASPYIDQTTNIELIYVLPNNRNIEVASSGKFLNFSERSNSLVYMYEARGISFKDVRIAMGTYKNQNLCDDGNLYTPSCANLNMDEFIEDVENITKYLTAYGEFSKPTILFTMCDISETVGKDLIVLNVSNLGFTRDIEQNVALKEKLCGLLCEQIFMFFNHSMVDSWIFQGLSGYLSDMAMRFLFGHNEFLYKIYMEKEFVIENDTIEPPLFFTNRRDFEYTRKFFKVKSKLVFHAIHNQLSGAFLKKIIVAVIKLKSAEVIANTVAENKNRHPLISPPNEASEFPRKKVKVKISSPVTFQKNIKIELPQRKSPIITIAPRTTLIDNIISSDYVASEQEACFTPFFIKIIKDSSGKDMKTFFDFYVFNAGLLIFDLNVKINLKKGLVNIDTVQTGTSKIKTANSSFYSIIKLKSVETDGTFNQKVLLNSTNTYSIHKKTENGNILFIRVDCRREHLCKVRVLQSEQFFIEQLLDKNVTGQLEALEYFKNNTSKKAIEVLERVAESNSTFYRVKSKIYEILKDTQINTYQETGNKTTYNGLMRLIQIFIKTRCVPNSTVVKNTELGVLNYYSQKALVKSITDAIAEDKQKVKVIVSFLNNILNYNDTNKEHFDDPVYLSNILNKLTMHKIDLDAVDEVLLSELERFRLLDMVFSSPKNVMTKTCLLCYLRLAYVNKVRLNVNFLKNLSMYPNYIDLKSIALEGLFIFFIEEVEFERYTDSIDILEAMLKIIIRMTELGFKNIKTFVKDNTDNLLKYYNLYIGHRIREYFEIILSKIVLNEIDYIQHSVYEINYALENKQGISMVVEQVLGSKKISIVDFVKLKLMVFKKTMKLRLPYTKKVVEVEESEPYDRNIMVTLKYKKYRPIKVFKTNILRLLATNVVIKQRNCDIPQIIIQTIRGVKSFTAVEKYLRQLRYMEKYDSEAVPVKRIEEEFTKEKLVLAHMRNKNKDTSDTSVEKYTLRSFLDHLYRKCFRFVFLYVPVNSKLYLGCKSVVNAMEKCVYQYTTIPKKVVCLNGVLRDKCIEFVTKLVENPRFVHFKKDVNVEEYKNYVDVVRHTVCLEKILKKLTQEEDVVQNEVGSFSSCSIKYNSFECFIFDLEKVAQNAMLFNPKISALYHTAEILMEEITFFKLQLTLVKRNSKELLVEVFRKYDTKNFDFEFDWDAIRTWNNLDDEIAEVKKKYSRYSVNGKMVNDNINKARKVVESYFPIRNTKILQVDEC